MITVILDLESQSPLNIEDVDAWTYSRNISTIIISLVCKIENKISFFDYDDCQNPNSPKMQSLYRLLARPDVIIVCHNAAFEIYMMLNVWKWELDPAKFVCTMAKAAYHHLPQSLDGAARACNLPLLKDLGDGYQTMLKLAKVEKRREAATPQTHPIEFQKLYKYNEGDVIVTELLHKAIPDLSSHEREVWQMDFEINKRGVPIDWFLVENANILIAQEKEKIDAQIAEITDGALKSARQTIELAKWLSIELKHPINSVVKEYVTELLTQPWLTEKARQVLKLRQLAGLSSLGKFKALKKAMDPMDNRIRDNYWYYGAHTGRWTGKGVQITNLYKGCDVQLSNALSLSDIAFTRAFYPKPLAVLPLALRGSIYSGLEAKLLWVDLSQIEARVTALLGNEENTLAIYRRGEDVYCYRASKLFGRTITKADKFERDGGKTAELSCGFGGGVGALERGCKKFNVDIAALAKTVIATQTEIEKSKGSVNWYYDQQEGTLPIEQAQALAILVHRWRADNPNTVAMWKELFEGFIVGKYDNGKIRIGKTTSGNRVVTLPSKRQLFFRRVQILDNRVSYIKRVKGQETRVELTAGKFFENVVQAFARDVEVWYMLKAKKLAPIIMHTYDEYVLEIPNEKFEHVKKAVHNLHTNETPPFAEGLIVAFEMGFDIRYSK